MGSPRAGCSTPRGRGPTRSSTRPLRPHRPPPKPPAATSTDDKLAQLKQLGELRDAGVLTDAEFEGQKGKILYGS